MPEPPTPEPPRALCVVTHGGDCVTAQAFEESANALVDGYAAQDGFKNQWALARINAGLAYSRLRLLQGADAEPGAGVTIGFLDTGIDTSHPMFAGKSVHELFMANAVDETGEDRFSHGTAVASVAAAARTQSSTAAWGVASGADIAMFSIPVGSGGGEFRPISLGTLNAVDERWAGFIDTILNWRDGTRKVDFLNLSITFTGIIDNYGAQDLRDNFGNTIAAMAQAGAAEKTVLVWAAGNSHGDSCSAPTPNCENNQIDAVSVHVLQGLPVRISELRGHVISVVALGESDGAITSFSNRCGLAADYCIAAPGQGMTVAYFGPNPNSSGAFRGVAPSVNGTSFAAPVVSGGLALMKQIFRGQLSNTDLVTRLFATADKSGIYANRAIYGQGAMDLGAATSPVGVLEVPGLLHTAQDRYRLTSVRLQPGPALGDALEHSLAGREIMALDRLGAPFWYRLGSFTRAAGGIPVAARVRSFLAAGPGWSGAPVALTMDRAAAVRGGVPARLHAARLDTPAEIRGSHLALAEGAVQATLGWQDGLAAAAFTTKGIPGRRPALGAALSWRRPGSPLGLRAGWIGEPETLLGSVGEGAFGTFGADTSFVAADVRTDLGRWRVGASAELGTAVPEAKGGFVQRVSALTTSAFALHAARDLAGAGAVRFSVSQPLRVEGGRASLMVPTGRSKAGAVSYDAVPARLSPSGRQIDFAGEWRRPLPTGELRLGAVLSRRPGHRRDAGPELTLLSGWLWQF